MKCNKCHGKMLKIARRNEMAELDENATDGQMADYLAADLSGDHGAWNLGIVEYLCSDCKLVVQVVDDHLPNYYPLIRAWHDKAAEGDSFGRFVFQYLSFIAHVKNNLFYATTRDRIAIQKLKQDQTIKNNYLERVNEDSDLNQAWIEVIEELNNKPLYNSSIDLDYPEIVQWWNSSELQPNAEDDQPKGRVLSLNDWNNMVEFWIGVRNNLFHGGKNPSFKRDAFLVEHAFLTLRPLMDIELETL